MEYKDLVGFTKYLVDYQILFAYIMFGIALFSALVFAAVPLFRDFKKALTTLISVGGVALFYIVCYMLTSGDPFTYSTGSGDFTISGGVMKFVEANLFMTYVTFAISILAIVYSSISTYFK